MQLFSKSKQQILDDVPWLRRQNARGMEVYIRPEGHQGLILVDDITAKHRRGHAAERLHAGGGAGNQQG